MLLSACGKVRENEGVEKQETYPTYSRKVASIELTEGFNSYMMSFSQTGIGYYVIGENMQENGEIINSFSFYIFLYEDMKNYEVATLSDCYVMDIGMREKSGRQELVILWSDEKAHISTYDLQGRLIEDIELENRFNSVTSYSQMKAVEDDKYVICLENTVYYLDENGNSLFDLTVPGRIKKLIGGGKNDFILLDASGLKTGRSHLCKIDSKERIVSDEIDMPDGIYDVFATDSYILGMSENYLYNIDFEGNSTIALDVSKQLLLASSIKSAWIADGTISVLGINGNDVILLSFVDCSFDDNIAERVISEEKGEKKVNIPDNKIISEDGRRILYLAAPLEEEGVGINYEFHALLYNQISEKTVVEVVRYDDNLEDFLGRGNRPDIVVFPNSTYLEPFIERNYLVDIIPLFDQKNDYSLDDILPSARNVLGYGESLYGIGGQMHLLVRFSSEDEIVNGECSTREYLDYYNNLLVKTGSNSKGYLEDLIYSSELDFYDSKGGNVSFDSQEFKAILDTYKAIEKKYTSKPYWEREDLDDLETQIIEGPQWISSLTWNAMADSRCKLLGLPTFDGKQRLLAYVNAPMSIMKTSDMIEESFDFIMYFCNLPEYLRLGVSEYEYGKSALANSCFYVFKEELNKEIFETEKPYLATKGAGASQIEFHYFSTEQKNMIQELLDTVEGDTYTHRRIDEIVREEIGYYINDNNNLDETCKRIQSRVSLFMTERK